MSVEDQQDVPDNGEEEEQEASEGEEAVEGEEAEEGAGENGEEPEAAGAKGQYNAKDVNHEVFEELHLSDQMWNEVQLVWTTFLKSSESREAAGEAIYAALFDSAPSLQSLFKTPRAVMAMRFMNGLSQIIGQLGDPKALKIVVETLGFQHLDLEVTPPRVVIFRDAIVDLLAVEMGARFTNVATEGFNTFLNYVGGSYIYVRTKFTVRLKIISSSWATANKKADELAEAQAGADGEEGENKEEGEGGSGEVAAQAQIQVDESAGKNQAKKTTKKAKKAGWGWGSKDKDDSAGDGGSGKAGAGDSKSGFQDTNVPTTFNDMFMFNAAVMGFANNNWMVEVLASFDAMVLNVANSYRLQEECDVLALKIAKTKGVVNLVEYKSVMLASLRSLVPKDWNSDHEVAWSWLWENVQRMLTALLGKPAAQEAALGKLWASLTEENQAFVRREVYAKFFAIAPAGQDYFKQSTTRLHFIADKACQMTLDMYKDPKRMVEEISALGLRHVGYGIPTDLFGAFVTGCVQVVRILTKDEVAEDAFRWSLNLISRILMRVINEGSTIVMKAINQNSGKQLRKAVGCAPRGRRSLWVLNIQVGTQSISPFLWAIEAGSLEAAKSIIVDLLTIRADRERYYYGMDILFERHADVIKRLCVDAPALLPVLLDGLVWRSRTTENGQRRVNYYVKYLLTDEEGEFSKAIEWITDSKDPKIVCHPLVAMVTDMVWSNAAYKTFLSGKLWFLFTLVVFVASQSVLNHIGKDYDSHEAVVSDGSASGSSSGGRLLSGSDTEEDQGVRITIFACRCFIYVFSMGQWVFFHGRQIWKEYRAKETISLGWWVKVPAYLMNWQDVASLLLTIFLILMLCLEPIVRCFGGDYPLFTESCPAAQEILYTYSIVSTFAMVLYYLLLVDLAVFSTRLSAFALVVARVLSEVALFLFGLTFFAVAFASAISSLEQDDENFAGIPQSGLSLLKITLGMFAGSRYDNMSEFPALIVVAFFYVIVSVVFLLNLLIAQLNCAYQSSYQDMLGYARLNRGKIVTDTMPSVPSWRWHNFIQSLKLDERVEFGEGDQGVSGGVQVLEQASLNITTIDMIRRFGGSTSVAAQWPEDVGDDDDDRYDRIEKMIEKAIKRMSSSGGGKRRHGAASGTGTGTGTGTGSDQHGSSSGEDQEGGDSE